MANKHMNKTNGRVYELTKEQRGEVAELQCAIMKKRELRRQQFEAESQAEIKELETVANRFAAELSVDIKQYLLNLDNYRFEPRPR